MRNSDFGLRILGKPKTPKPAGGALFRLCRSKFKGPGAGRSQARCFRDETCLVIPKRCRATAVQRNLYRLFSVILGCSRLFSGSPPAPLRRGIFFGRIIHRTKGTYRTEGVPPSSAFFRLLPGGGGGEIADWGFRIAEFKDKGRGAALCRFAANFFAGSRHGTK